jgi:hypothetical protein
LNPRLQTFYGWLARNKWPHPTRVVFVSYSTC